MIEHSTQQRSGGSDTLRPGSLKPWPGAQTELRAFTDALFPPDDLVELRLVESWNERGKSQARVLSRSWQRAAELPAAWASLAEKNAQGANIYFGVNPRTGRGGRKDSVRTIRSVWADFDGIDLAEARSRWLPHLPEEPSIVVASGHGVHAYWLLRRPFVIRRERERRRFEAMLKAIYRRLGCDSVQDVSRVLRLPGFWNVKGHRNGASPVPCTVLHLERHRRYPFASFAPAWNDVGDEAPRTGSRVGGAASGDANVGQLAAELNRHVRDRSARDFAIVMRLLRQGLSAGEIWTLVHDKSKFRDRPDYFETTLRNALRELGTDD